MALIALDDKSVLLVRPTTDDILRVTKNIEVLDGGEGWRSSPNKSALIYTVDPTHTHVALLTPLAEQPDGARIFFAESPSGSYPYSLRGSNSLPINAIVLMLVTTWTNYWDLFHFRGNIVGYGKLPLFCRGAAKLLGCTRAEARRTIDRLLEEPEANPTPPDGRDFFTNN